MAEHQMHAQFYKILSWYLRYTAVPAAQKKSYTECSRSVARSSSRLNSADESPARKVSFYG